MPGTRCGGRFSSIATRSASGNSSLRDFSNNSRLPRRQVYISSITKAPSASGTQPPSQTFKQVRRKEGQIEKQERRDQRGGGEWRPLPDFPDHDKAHHPRNHHGAGDRNAIGRRQRARRAEHQHQQHHRDQQHPVDARNVDLAGMGFRGVADFESRHQSELDGLARQRIGAGDHGLARNHGRGRRESDHRDQRPVRKHQEERVFDRLGIDDDESALPEIVQRQRRQHDEQPRGLDRPFAEMAEVGVKRLRTGDGEEHGSERDEADHAVMEHERNGIKRVQRQQHFGLPPDRMDRGNRDDAEPDAHDRPEEGGDTRGAARLDRKQRQQNDHRHRHHIGIERRGDELDTFDGREHRQRRRDHGVAVEQGAADDPEQHDRAGAAG